MREHARFFINHLPRLTNRPDQIKQLRQTILNLAVRGQLISQEPKDEPVSELLKRIQAEKARLLKDGMISRQKSISEHHDRSTSDLPAKWACISFDDVCNLVTSGSRGWAEFYSDTGPRFIRAQNIRFGKLRLDDLACVTPPKKAEGLRTQVTKSDLLVVITGAGVTNPALLDQELGEAYVTGAEFLLVAHGYSISPLALDESGHEFLNRATALNRGEMTDVKFRGVGDGLSERFKAITALQGHDMQFGVD
jgi:type I restriction enzyme S subunit